MNYHSLGMSSNIPRPTAAHHLPHQPPVLTPTVYMSIIMNSDTEICSIARTITSSSETACVCYVAFVRILQGLTLIIVLYIVQNF